MSFIIYLLLGIFQTCVFRIIQSLLIGEMVEFFLNPASSDFPKVVACAVGLIICVCAYSFLGNQCYSGGSLTGIRIKSACSFLLYKKSLRLGTGAFRETNVGQIVNLLSNNFNQFQMVCGIPYIIRSVVIAGNFFPFFLAPPFQLIITCFILYTQLGFTIFIGCAAILLQLIFQLGVARIVLKFRTNTGVFTDQRIRLVNESISSMKVIKMCNLEKPVRQQIDDVRRKELSKRLLTTILDVVSDLSHLSGKLTTFATIVAYYLISAQPLSTKKVFITMAFLENLRLSMRLFNLSLHWGVESLANIRRFQKFLELEEKCYAPLQKEPNPSLPAVSFSGVTAKWDKSNDIPTLDNISLAIKQGELVTVVGHVGAGKSSLFLALLGELPLSAGQIEFCGKIAYVSQDPWLFSGSVRDNILVFSDANDKKYKEIIMACALAKVEQFVILNDKDLSKMKYSDKTLVGEKGTQLSGGQKARVNLARTTCVDADIYLLDDPLSAVDASVCKHIFYKCINGYLKDKTRIVITHYMPLIKSANRILIVNAGKIMAFDTYEELVRKGIDVRNLCKEIKEQPKEMTLVRKESSLMDTDRRSSHQVEASARDLAGRRKSSFYMIPETSNIVAQEEEHIDGSRYIGAACWNYWKTSGTIFGILMLVILFPCAQFSFNLIDIFLSFWHSSSSTNIWSSSFNNYTTFDNTTMIHVEFLFIGPLLTSDNSYLFTYIALISILILLWLARSYAFLSVTYLISRNLHKEVTKTLFNVPVAFFNENPAGRILNRLTKDMGNIDESLPRILLDLIAAISMQIGYLVVVIIYIPWIAIIAFVCILFGLIVGKFYIKPSTSMQRLVSNASSPVYSHLSNSLHGLHIIRAFHAEEMFTRKFCALQDVQTVASCYFIAAGNVFSFFNEFLGIVLIVCIEIFSFFIQVDASSIGLVVLSFLQMALAFQFIAVLTVQVISMMVSVERVFEYKNLQCEIRQSKQPPPNWPDKGAIVFKNVSLKYGTNGPPSLKFLNFAINPSEKIGIVGRTGAGKSSIISALLRLYEPEGNIYIDDVLTTDIDVYELRNRISVIPQDPVLFSGQLRKSIDPFNQYPDSKLWAALEQVQMKAVISDLPNGLDTILNDRGEGTFSTGQSQLICLARAIVSDSKVLILDEATASVDNRTETIIQTAIQEKLRNCSVLMIAHRLETITDCNRLMVLEGGQILEFDEPHLLLQNKKGHFNKLAKESGSSGFHHLQEKAAASFMNRHGKEGEISN